MLYLHETLVREFGKREFARTEVPNTILDNLRPGYGRRPYQIEAFQRFLLCYNEEFDGKPEKPLHLLYNMATGSGKTLIMAGLILYLYEKGYRNFLFFVNSNNIINKTKDNFLNPQAQKYLFNNKIVVNGKEVHIKEIDNFEEVDAENINIKFTTIQQLHIDLNNTKENSITYEDFQDKKLVLIADEAHHLNTNTKANDAIEGSWEYTVDRLHKLNFENILLEFTATLDSESRELVEKYKDKVIFKYDLSQFRIDKYSKEINLMRSLYGQKERIIQALILSLYREELATYNNINLKPVILFKAKKTIKESEKNKEYFHNLIEDLNSSDIEYINNTSKIDVVQKAFDFFISKNINFNDIVNRIKANFKEENCISANNDQEAEKNQLMLNTLEDENNPIRAVFAVKKLNEGWDVLNLFDIVRLYEGRDGRKGKPGKTTISEAQLIGRGARYFPFKLEQGQDSYKRKFDDDIDNDLKILEELYYHTKEDNRYINEIKKALVDTGVYVDEDDLETKKLKIKDSFKKSAFYSVGKVFYNKRIFKNYQSINSFEDLGVSKRNFEYELTSGYGKTSGALVEEKHKEELPKEQKDIKVSDIPTHIVRYALTQYPFYYFNNIVKYFPNILSTTNLIKNENYLGGLEITLKGSNERLSNLSNKDYLFALHGLLEAIEYEIKSKVTEYEGSDYYHDNICNVFKDKEIKVLKNSERSEGQKEFLKDKPWYVYDANYGTKEEKKFVEMFNRRFNLLNQKYSNIYLVRNERVLKIYNKEGRPFEPDFLLFCKEDEKELIYQIFIEPKGNHLTAHDKWKEDFLLEIRNKERTITIDTDKYLITGVPFYNNESENDFRKSMEEVLEL